MILLKGFCFLLNKELSYFFRILNDIDNPKKVLRVVIEWDLSLKQRFLSYVVPEPILNDYSFYRKVESSDYDSKQSTISLTNLLDQFVGCGI